MRLTGKIAVVTAAGQGIGRASVLAMAKEGAQVWATDINAELLNSYAGIENVHTAKLDVLDKEAISAFMGGLDRVDAVSYTHLTLPTNREV